MNINFIISNYKVSVKVCDLDWKKTLELLKNCQLNFKQHSNFISFKSVYTFTLFKPKGNQAHANITNIKLIKEGSEALRVLQSLVGGKVLSHTFKIDNITASANLQKTVNLEKFFIQNHIHTAIKYNRDKFPAAFIKGSAGTILLFHSGKVILVGCKTKDQLVCLYTKLLKLL